MKILISSILVVLCLVSVNAQQKHLPCGTTLIDHDHEHQAPMLIAQQQAFFEGYKSYLKEKKIGNAKSSTTYKIPVVIHIMHDLSLIHI